MKPFIYTEKILGKQKKLIKATGLDNRIHTSLLLALVKFCRYETVKFCCLFSTEEESGMCGAEYFSNKVNLMKFHEDFMVPKKICILDVTKAILKLDREEKLKKEINLKEKKEEKEYWPLIGCGFVPIIQEFGSYPYMSRCNAREFNSGIYKDVPKMRLAVGNINMHSFDKSISCISDVTELFWYFVEKYESFLSKCKAIKINLNELEDHVKIKEKFRELKLKNWKFNTKGKPCVKVELEEYWNIGKLVKKFGMKDLYYQSYPLYFRDDMHYNGKELLGTSVVQYLKEKCFFDEEMDTYNGYVFLEALNDDPIHFSNGKEAQVYYVAYFVK